MCENNGHNACCIDFQWYVLANAAVLFVTNDTFGVLYGDFSCSLYQKNVYGNQDPASTIVLYGEQAYPGYCYLSDWISGEKRIPNKKQMSPNDYIVLPELYQTPVIPCPTYPDTRVTFPTVPSSATPEKTMENTIAAVNNTPWVDIVTEAGALNPTLPGEQTDDDVVPVSNWEWWDKLWQMIQEMQSMTSDVVNGLLDELEALREQLEESAAVSGQALDALVPALEQVEEALREGAITQEQADALAETIAQTVAQELTQQNPPQTQNPPAHFHLFPFCIPFDVVNMVKGLRETPAAPRWEIPLALPSELAAASGKQTEIITFDLSFLEPIMPFVRLMILLMFVIGLAKSTSSFIKW